MDRDQAISFLKERLSEGDTVYCILRAVSRSGTTRRIALYTIKNNRPVFLSAHAAKALQLKYDAEREGIVINGGGMDMGFELVYLLGEVLFRDGYALEHRWL